MPRIVRTARGEQVDFDAIVIKQKIAQAPMNIDVARRKEFIDSKEGKARGARRSTFIDGTVESLPANNRFVTGETTRQAVVNDAVSTKTQTPPAPAAAKPAAPAPAVQPADFEVEGAPNAVTKRPAPEAVPVIPERK